MNTINESRMKEWVVSGNLSRSNQRGSGYDLFSQYETYIPPGQSRLISTGVMIRNLPDGLYGYVVGTPELMIHHGVICTPMVVDTDYLGEIRIGLHNPGKITLLLEEGQLIATMVFSLSVHPRFMYPDSELMPKMPKKVPVDNRINNRYQSILCELG